MYSYGTVATVARGYGTVPGWHRNWPSFPHSRPMNSSTSIGSILNDSRRVINRYKDYSYSLPQVARTTPLPERTFMWRDAALPYLRIISTSSARGYHVRRECGPTDQSSYEYKAGRLTSNHAEVHFLANNSILQDIHHVVDQGFLCRACAGPLRGGCRPGRSD